MPLKSQTLPNKALTGEELRHILVKNFDKMLANDYAFMRTIAYSRVAVTLSATMHLGQPKEVHVTRSYTKADGVIEGEVPLVEPDDAAVLIGLERDVVLDNPNLARVHHDLPIKVQGNAPPRAMDYTTPLPGEPPPPFMTDPFPQVQTKEFRMDPTQYPPMTAPVDRDVSAEKAKGLGVKTRAMGLRDRVIAAPVAGEAPATAQEKK
jgi:hypothetical protein